jgi:hypothetical protein
MEFSEKYLLAIARALYITRVHLLTLTEVVRHRVQPDEDGLLRLPPELDEEMREANSEYDEPGTLCSRPLECDHA